MTSPGHVLATPLYEPADAARLVGLSRGQVARWLITPRRAAGAPTVKTRNLKTSTVFDLYLSEGRHREPVARWFNLDRHEVDAAVRYEEGLNEARAA